MSRDRKIIKRARRLRRSSTVAERALWDELRAHKLNGWGFRRQADIAGYVADFLCHEPQLIVELDGPVHALPGREERDTARDAELEALGFTVIRINERVVRERPQDALAWITFVGERLLQGLSPYPDDQEPPLL